MVRHGGSIAVWLAALAALCSCSAGAGTSPPPTAAPSTRATTSPSPQPPVPTPTPALAPRLVNWLDLDVGTCLADPPPVDPSIVTVAVVDCGSPHRAEVFLRAPMAVNTALADVADRACRAGFLTYTGRTIDQSPFTTTYLIDSDQNRTSANPNPSTVICLLQAATGEPLTASARR